MSYTMNPEFVRIDAACNLADLLIQLQQVESAKSLIGFLPVANHELVVMASNDLDRRMLRIKERITRLCEATP